ncbi:MAG: hypothetical protein LBN23_04905 [Paludibacter sp.]|jgi:hypothetical protein|nr:hypothetical protein [Paludibacter sp.]
MKTNHSFMEKCIERRIESGIHKSVYAFIHFIIGAAFVAAFGYVVMLLWNWLVPTVIGWNAVSYWQALGLLVLSKIFFGFGGLHFGNKRGHKNALRERWQKMTEEERQEFMQHRHFGCNFYQTEKTEKQN